MTTLSINDAARFFYANHLVYAVNGADELLALSPLTGATVWKLALPSYVSMSSPTVVGNMMYFGGTHPSAIYAVNLQTHHIQWMHTLPHPLGGSDDVPPAAADGKIYFDYVQQVHNQPHEVVYALNAQNGHTVWTKNEGSGTIPTGPNGGPRDETGIPTVYGNRLYVASPVTRTFYAFNLQTGALAFHVPFHSALNQGPVVYQGVCYLGDVQGNFYAINAATGHIRGQLHFQGAFMPSTPVLVGQTLYIGDKVGQFMAIPLSAFK